VKRRLHRGAAVIKIETGVCRMSKSGDSLFATDVLTHCASVERSILTPWCHQRHEFHLKPAV